MTPPPQEPGRIDELKEKLYSREMEGVRGVREHPLNTSSQSAVPPWQKPELDGGNSEVSPMRLPWLKYFFVGAFGFFFVAALYTAYIFFGGGNVVSSENIDLDITGPVSINSGEKITLLLDIRNRNRTPLDVVDLLVEYPKGTRSAENASQEMPRYREGLGTIEVGGEVHKNVSAILFGEERSSLDVSVTLEYRVKGSSAVFYKRSVYPVTITSSPLTVRADHPSEVASGDPVTITLTLASNAPQGVENVLLKAEYPPGFAYKSASPAPVLLNNVFRVGDLPPNGKRTVTIRGTLAGEDGDERVFRFESGIAREDNDKAIGTPLSALSEVILLKKSLLGLGLSINGSGGDVSIQSGTPARVEIALANNLPVPVENAEIRLSLSGTALDKASVSPIGGFYDSSANTVTWNQTTGAALGRIEAGESITVSVSMNALSRADLSTLTRPEIVLATVVTGERADTSREQLRATADGRVRIASDVDLSAKLLRYSGPLKNSGPMPPKVGSETTYTVVWNVTNGSSDVAEASVRANLPPNVRFVGGTTPGESITFNESTRVLTWTIGTIPSGAGGSQAPKEVYFQIGFTPSANQAADVPTLVSGITLTGKDSFTEKNITITEPSLPTRLTSDPQAKPGDETVVP